jgi:hypothetical protein
LHLVVLVAAHFIREDHQLARTILAIHSLTATTHSSGSAEGSTATMITARNRQYAQGR